MENTKNLYCLGELVHNLEVTQRLEKQGLKVIHHIKEAKEGSRVIFRAHGEPFATYEEAKKKEITVLDFSCPNVVKIHKMAQEFVKNKDYIILVAEKGHPETIGTFGFCGTNATIISSVEEAEQIGAILEEWKGKKVAVIAQTTFSMEKFDAIVETIQKVLPKGKILEVNKTICNATKLRQNETKQMAKTVECMIIIGGKKSSNTQKLYEISKEYCNNVYFIQTVADLPIDEVKKQKTIGIMAGASTPNFLIEEVKEALSYAM